MSDQVSKFAGMTVNERLAAAGLLSAYDDAKARGDTQRLRDIAAEVELRLDDDGMLWSDPGSKP